MKVPVNEAIMSGDWLICTCIDIKFRIRLLSMKRVSSIGIEYLNNYEDSTNLWHLMFDLVNLAKTALNPDQVSSNLILCDQDDFEFTPMNNDLYSGSFYSKTYKLNTIRINAPHITPKIITTGALAYKLPKDDEAEYSIMLKGGTVRGE